MARAPFLNEDAYDTVIRVAANNFGVPFALVKGMIGQESRFNPKAYRAEVAIGDASRGLMQILLRTARGEGFVGTADELFDPLTNVTFGVKYLAEQIGRAGSIEGGVSAYNGGYNPTAGFGQRATKPVRVCLARDNTGKCIQYRDVPVGEYANQQYVNDVLYNFAYYAKKDAATQTPPPILVSPPLDSGNQSNESQADCRNSGSATRTLGTQIWEALKGLWQWFKRRERRRR